MRTRITVVVAVTPGNGEVEFQAVGYGSVVRATGYGSWARVRPLPRWVRDRSVVHQRRSCARESETVSLAALLSLLRENLHTFYHPLLLSRPNTSLSHRVLPNKPPVRCAAIYRGLLRPWHF